MISSGKGGCYGGLGRNAPGNGQAVVEVIETRISAGNETFGNSKSRIRIRVNLGSHDMIEPAFSVTDVDDCVRAIIDDCLLLHSDAKRTVYYARASLWRKQLDGTKSPLCTESVTARNAAPQHDVHTSENLPWKIGCGRSFE